MKTYYDEQINHLQTIVMPLHWKIIVSGVIFDIQGKSMWRTILLVFLFSAW